MERLKIVINVLAFLFLASCNQLHQVPDPPEFSSYAQPETLPLELTDPVPLHWDTLHRGTITPKVFPLDLTKLKSEPWDSTGFQPLAAPTETAFDFASLPGKPFDLENIPTHAIKMEWQTLPIPGNAVPVSKPSRITNSTLDLRLLKELSSLGGLGITSVIKNKDGIYFLTSPKGLYTYDGIEVKLLSPAYVAGGVFDDAENFWFLGWAARTGYEIYMMDFKNKLLGSCKLPMSFDMVIMGKLDKKGRIWIPGTRTSSPIVIDPVKKNYRILDANSGLSSTWYYQVSFDDQNRVWMNSRNGIDVVDIDKKQIYNISRKNGLSADTVRSLVISGDRIVTASRAGIDEIDVKGKKIIHHPLGGDYFSVFLMIDPAGQVWSGGLGLDIFNFSNNTTRHVGSEDGLTSTFVRFLIQTGNGDVLIITPQGDNTANLFLIGQYGKTVFPLKDEGIISTTEDSKGNLWIGTETGLIVVDSSRKQYWKLDPSNGLASPFVQSITQENGKIIITTNGGYNIYDPQKNVFERVGKMQGLITDTMFSLVKDRQGNLWTTGTSAGIIKYDVTGNYVLGLNASGGLNGNFVSQIMPLEDRKIAVATYESGPCIIDIPANTIQFIKRPEAINKTSYKSMTVDKSGRLWICGTENFSLFAIDLKNRTLTSFTTKNGLSNNSVASVLEYNGKLMATTNNKVNIITPPELTSANKWEVDVLKNSGNLQKSSNSFQSDGVSKRDNYLWGDLGLGVVYGIKPDTSKSVIVLSGIKLMGKEISFAEKREESSEDTLYKNLGSLSESGYTEKNSYFKWDSLSGPNMMPEKLSLPADQNVIQFHFKELSVGRPDSAEYAYVLEGIDKNWTFTYDRQTETYLNLSPGDYMFKVTSRWSSGRWNTPETFRFTILPPWYKTWWAYLIFATILLVILRLYIVFRSRKLKRENKVLDEKVKHRTIQLQQSLDNLKRTQSKLIQSEKMASLGELTAGIAHEIQNPLNFVNNFSEINIDLIKEMQQEIDKGNLDEVRAISSDVLANGERIMFHGKRADSIVKGMLQHSRSTSGVKEPTDINTLCDEFLRLAFHGLRARDKSFNANFLTDFDPTVGKVDVVPQDMGRSLLNLITNAFYEVNEKRKTTTDSDYSPTVKVSTKNLGSKVQITVYDNGGGIPAELREKIFQPFFTTKPTGEGTGLGLSMSYDIITKGHGGELLVESEDRESTTFKIILPNNNKV